MEIVKEEKLAALRKAELALAKEMTGQNGLVGVAIVLVFCDGTNGVSASHIKGVTREQILQVAHSATGRAAKQPADVTSDDRPKGKE